MFLVSVFSAAAEASKLSPKEEEAMRACLDFGEARNDSEKSFELVENNDTSKVVSFKGWRGTGGSKEAYELSDGQIVMLPKGCARWWVDAVEAESQAIKYLNQIGVLGLNRREATLRIPSKSNPQVAFDLPVLLSDSFERYADKGWYISDVKNPNPCFKKIFETDFTEFLDRMRNDDRAAWEQYYGHFVEDYVRLVVMGVQMDGDSANRVVLKLEGKNLWELRYFGFDFSGKYANWFPSEDLSPFRKDLNEIISLVKREVRDTLTFSSAYLIARGKDKFGGSRPTEDEISIARKNGNYLLRDEYIKGLALKVIREFDTKAEEL